MKEEFDADEMNRYYGQHIYIAQSLLESEFCQIGLANNLKGKLKIINSKGTSKNDIYRYVFTCKVKDMIEVDYDTRKNFWDFKINDDDQDTFWLSNEEIFKKCVEFIKSHPLFIEQIYIKENIFDDEIEKTTDSSLKNEKAQQLTLSL